MSEEEIVESLTKEIEERGPSLPTMNLDLLEHFRRYKAARDRRETELRQSIQSAERRGAVTGYHKALEHMKDFDIRIPEEMVAYALALGIWAQEVKDEDASVTEKVSTEN
jgi:uncharacterized membrane protein